MGAEVILKRADPAAPLKMRLSISKEEYGIYFKPAEWNAMVKYSLLGAGQMWMWNYLPLRFAGYARAAGLYTGKKRRGLPLVETGYLREHTLTNSRAKAVAQSTKAYIDLIIPDTQIIKTFSKNKWKAKKQYDKGVVNYSSNPVVQKGLSRITEREIERMGVTFSATMQSLIDNADKKSYKSGDQAGQIKRMSLTPQQRSSLGIKQRARRTPSTTQRKT